MTTRAMVARYWASPEGRQRWPRAVTDFGEPSCMACGYFSRRWDEARTVDARWNQSALERAHIVAASAGGPDDPSNYVLLCAKCHAAAPMTRDDRSMFAWCERRISHTAAQVNALRDELVTAGTDLESLAGLAALSLDELRAALKRAAESITAGTHLVRMSPSTQALTLQRMAEDLAARAAAPATSPRDGKQLSLFGEPE